MSILTPETGQPPMYLFVGHLIVSFCIQLADWCPKRRLTDRRLHILLALTVARDGHLAVVANLQSDAILDASRAAQARAHAAAVRVRPVSQIQPIPRAIPFPSMTTAPSSPAALHANSA